MDGGRGAHRRRYARFLLLGGAATGADMAGRFPLMAEKMASGIGEIHEARGTGRALVHDMRVIFVKILAG